MALVGVDLFAGAGGLSLGAEMAGITVKIAVENNIYAAQTYHVNHPNTVVIAKNVQEITGLQLDREGNTLILFGGPPCQGFSMANRQRIIDDPRNQLYKEYLKLLSVVRPKFFIMENVRGMSNKWEEIRENFETYLNSDDNKKYQFSSHLLYAEDFGVPQHRERFIVIGNRLGISPEKVFDEIFKNKKKPFVLRRSRVKIILKMTTVAIQNVILHIREMIFIAS